MLRIPLLWLGLATMALAGPVNVVIPPNNQPLPPIEVPAGAALKLLAIHNQEVYSRLDVTITAGGATVSSTLALTEASEYPTKVIGPATVVFKGIAEPFSTIVSYSISDPAEEVKSTPVAVPDDDSGDYEVSLESSSDLENWSPATPGTYPSTTGRRFFRLTMKKP